MILTESNFTLAIFAQALYFAHLKACPVNWQLQVVLLMSLLICMHRATTTCQALLGELAIQRGHKG